MTRFEIQKRADHINRVSRDMMVLLLDMVALDILLDAGYFDKIERENVLAAFAALGTLAVFREVINLITAVDVLVF